MVGLKVRTGVTAVCGAVVGAVMALLSHSIDGRTFRGPIQQRFSVRNDTWAQVESDELLSRGWFARELRCRKSTFDRIADMVEAKWNLHFPFPDPVKSVFTIRERVAVTIYHLTHCCSYSSSGSEFGMSKSRTILFVNQVITVLLLSYKKRFIHLPRNHNEWMQNASEFEAIAGLPNVVGAIDGSLFAIQRPMQYEGWYNRKNYTSFNVQLVCDAKLRFMSYSIKPGSCNDQSVYNHSAFW
jgi:hypothetical protein